MRDFCGNENEDNFRQLGDILWWGGFRVHYQNGIKASAVKSSPAAAEKLLVPTFIRLLCPAAPSASVKDRRRKVSFRDVIAALCHRVVQMNICPTLCCATTRIVASYVGSAGLGKAGNFQSPPPSPSLLRLCVISRQQNNAKQWKVEKQETTV